MTDTNHPQFAFHTPQNSRPFSPSILTLGSQPLANTTQPPVLHQPSSTTNNQHTITAPLPALHTSTKTKKPHTSTEISTPTYTNIAPK